MFTILLEEVVYFLGTIIDDYFQKYLKAHLDRGARMIYSEFKYSGDFVMALLKKDTTI